MSGRWWPTLKSVTCRIDYNCCFDRHLNLFVSSKDLNIECINIYGIATNHFLSLEKSCKAVKSLRNIAPMRLETLNNIIVKRKDTLEEIELFGSMVNTFELEQCKNLTLLKFKYLFCLCWEIVPSLSFITTLELPVSGQAMSRLLSYNNFRETFKQNCLPSLTNFMACVLFQLLLHGNNPFLPLNNHLTG